MIRSLCSILLIGLVLAGCKKKDKMPADVMNPDKMQAVMWDVLRANAYANEYLRRDSSRSIEKEQAKLQLQVFNIHKITKNDFDKSYAYYQDHPEKMVVMIDTMVARVNRSKKTKVIQGGGDN